MNRASRSSRAAGLIALVATAACSSGSLLPASPPAKPDPDPAYPGRCSFVELQAVEKPSPGRGSGPDNLGTGTVELVATYRPGRRAPQEQPPVGYAFRVQQERVDDLRAHLQQQPEILCEGESMDGNAKAPGAPAPAPSFEGQQGRRITVEPAATAAESR